MSVVVSSGRDRNSLRITATDKEHGVIVTATDRGGLSVNWDDRNSVRRDSTDRSGINDIEWRDREIETPVPDPPTTGMPIGLLLALTYTI